MAIIIITFQYLDLFQKEQKEGHSVFLYFSSMLVNCVGAVVWPKQGLQHELCVLLQGLKKVLFCFILMRRLLFGLYHTANPVSNRINDKIAALNRDCYFALSHFLVGFNNSLYNFKRFFYLGIFFPLLSYQQSWLENSSFIGSSILLPQKMFLIFPILFSVPLFPTPSH